MREGRARLEPTRTAPRGARDALRRGLADAGVAPGSIEVALLLTSELVSNAVLHARTPVTVHYVVDGDVYVGVTDDDPRHPRVQEPRATDTGGRGVLLVDALADSWGVEPTADGKTVFFRLRRDLG